jgi:Tol biopolymer transport system component
MQHAGRFRHVGAALVAALFATSALAFAPVPAEGPKEEKIVFTAASREAKTVAIAIMNPDGSKRTTLTADGALEMDPALSPDGKRIAFVVVNKDDMTGDVWVMNIDGKQRKKLTEHPAKTIAMGVNWSADGKRIAFGTMTGLDKPTEAQVVVMDADGKNPKVVGKGLLPAWSPDGKKILYTAVSPGPGNEPRLAVMDADGQNVKELTTTPGLMGAWSPDGKKIVYVGAPGMDKFQPHVYVANADGSGATPLTKDDGEQGELAPRWSADGKRIYFNRLGIKGPPEKTGIWVMDADGSNMKELTKGDGMDLLGGAGLFVIERAGAARKP